MAPHLTPIQYYMARSILSSSLRPCSHLLTSLEHENEIMSTSAPLGSAINAQHSSSSPRLLMPSLSLSLQAVRPSYTFVPRAPARTVAPAQSAGVASAVTVLWALVAKTVASVSGHRGAGGPYRVSKACSWGRMCNPTSLMSSAMAHPYHFYGNGSLSWDFGNDVTVSVPWYLGLAFRTRATKGVLMQVQLGPHSVLLCQVCLFFQSFTTRINNTIPLNSALCMWYSFVSTVRNAYS